MRTIPFRDVLWDIARKNSIDPESDNFSDKAAISIGVYVDQWVRRTYPGADWPEWTTIDNFSPDSNHIVPWDNPSAFQGDNAPVRIGRVFTVYLVDPRTTNSPAITDHTKMDAGIHCGFEHGSSVWMKYMPPAPRFSAVPWMPDETYQKDDIRFSNTTGECYRSKVSGNIGHDPSTTFSPPRHVVLDQPPIKIDTDITVPLTPSDPGLAAQTQKLVLTMAFRSQTADMPNPPPALSTIAATIVDASGISLSVASSVNNGTDTLDLILADLANQLIADLGAGWNITTNVTDLSITIENASQFSAVQWIYFPNGGPEYALLQKQSQTYIPAVGGSQGIRQETEMIVTPDQIAAGATYNLTFKDVAGADHVASYVAQEGDGPKQVLTQLSAAIQTAGIGDDFFDDVLSTVDFTASKIVFKTTSPVSVDANFVLPGSPWWELQLMPLDLADQIMRGATADVLKQWGQTQLGQSEEQLVPTEAQASASKFAPNPAPLTSQLG